jgi:hypothetical protein
MTDAAVQGRLPDSASAPIESFSERLLARLHHRRLVFALSHGDYRRYLGGIQLSLRVTEQQLASASLSFVNAWRDGDMLWLSADGADVGAAPIEDALAALNALAASGAITMAAIDIHHIKSWQPDDISQLLDASAPTRVRFFLHDYFTICENPNLTFGDRVYCGAPPSRSDACTVCRYGEARRSREASIARLIDTLGMRPGTEFIAPSQCAAEVWSARYPEQRARVRVVPHQELVSDGSVEPPPDGPLRLGFVGWGTATKGIEAWRALIDDIRIRAPYVLSHLGLCSIGCAAHHVEVDFIRDGRDAMKRAIIEARLDFVFLWSIWPETFSFTCYEAIAAGAHVLTNSNSGNIAATVRRTGRGRVFADLDEARRFLTDVDAVVSARAARAGHPRLHATWTDTLTRELM